MNAQVDWVGAKSEEAPAYGAAVAVAAPDDDAIIAKALAILAGRLKRGASMSSPQAVKDFLQLQIGGLEHEVFGILFLDSQHRVIEWCEMFRGTLSQASVYPREVVKKALLLNAGAVVLSHNHPSGQVEPSRADEFLTQNLKSALALVDVRVLDHIIVGNSGALSFAERGIL